MKQYALTDGTTVLKTKSFVDGAKLLTKSEAVALGKPWFVEIIKESRPEYDHNTHHAPLALDPVFTDTTATYGWAQPVAKTQQEIDEMSTALKDISIERLDEPSSFEKALGMAVFELVNQVRDLNSQAPITAQQFKSYLRSKM